jgi:hypothetical protein
VQPACQRWPQTALVASAIRPATSLNPMPRLSLILLPYHRKTRSAGSLLVAAGRNRQVLRSGNRQNLPMADVSLVVNAAVPAAAKLGLFMGRGEPPQCATASSEAVPCVTAVHCLPCGKQWHTAMNNPG